MTKIAAVRLDAGDAFAQQMVAAAMSRTPTELGLRGPWGPCLITRAIGSHPMRQTRTVEVQLLGGKTVTASCLILRKDRASDWKRGYCSIPGETGGPSRDYYTLLVDDEGDAYLQTLAVLMGTGDPELAMLVRELKIAAGNAEHELPNKCQELTEALLPTEDGCFVIAPWHSSMRLFVNFDGNALSLDPNRGLADDTRITFTSSAEGVGFTIDFPSGGQPAVIVGMLPATQKADVFRATRLLQLAMT